jgi:hypothetical protein
MADRKISELTNITGANLADGDELVVVDASASETKAITFGEFKNALDTATGFVSITGDTMTGDLALSGADITFGDNDKAIFGAGSDLQIYHDGSNSIITDQGTGNLKINASSFEVNNFNDSSNILDGNAAGAVKLYHAGSQKLTTTSTGVDITGTLTSDGLTVDGSAKATNTVQITGGATFPTSGAGMELSYSSGSVIRSYDRTGSSYQPFSIRTGLFDIQTNGTKRADISTNGDISFYEDTGTTAKFFWDASAESLGIGTSSPSGSLHLLTPAGSSGNENTKIPLVVQENSFSSANLFELRNSVGGALSAFDQSGNLGIGTSSPQSELHVSSSANADLRLSNDTVGNGTNDGLTITMATTGNASINNRENASMLFYTNNTEAARFDASGNLLVGKTSANTYNTTAGFETRPDGLTSSTRDGAIALILNRLTSDGDIAVFRKDGSTVGSIGASGNFYLASNTAAGAGGIRFGNDVSTTLILPSTNTGANKDGNVNLGYSNSRFKDLYLSGGVYLGGTGSANKLEDYEYGTFTPSYTPTSGSFTSIGYASRVGEYIKVGDVVTCHVLLKTSSLNKTGASGNVTITGFPFNPDGGTSLGAVGSIAAQDNWLNFFPTSGWVNSIGAMTCINNDGASTSYIAVPIANMATGSNQNRIYLSVTYIIA